MGKKNNAAEANATVENEKKNDNAVAEKETGDNMLEKVGKAAIKEHGLKEVFVTADGVVFRAENDAKNYALNLKNRSILNVKK